MPRKIKLSLPKLVRWLRTKPAHEGYDFISPDACLLSQFLSETRGRPFSVGPDCFSGLGDDRREEGEVTREFDYIARGAWDGAHRAQPKDEAWTFGAALARALEVREMVRQGAL